MKTLIVYLMVVAWCACWFCACGGDASDVSVSNSNSQEQNQTGDGDIQTAQEACLHCFENKGPSESLNDCLIGFGFDASDC